MPWHLRKKPSGTQRIRPIQPIKPVQPVKAVKPIRSVKPIAPVGYEYYWRD